MSDEPRPQVGKPGGAGTEPPPPFVPDEDLITYLESGREPNPQVDKPDGAGEGPPPPFVPDEDLITYLEKGRRT
jgi:hypothetical protein